MSAVLHRPTAADTPLPLDGIDVDVALPLWDERPEQTVPVDEVDRLRIALAEALSYVETCRPAPGNRVRAWRALVPVAPGVDRTETPWDRAVEGTLRAAAKWTEEEVAEVDKAIATVAARVRGSLTVAIVGEEVARFTADDVWTELGPGFTVTKGLTGRLLKARNDGLIASTGRTVISTRQGVHGHGQRLTVWRAL